MLEACLQACNREEVASEVCDHGFECVTTFPCKSIFLFMSSFLVLSTSFALSYLSLFVFPVIFSGLCQASLHLI